MKRFLSQMSAAFMAALTLLHPTIVLAGGPGTDTRLPDVDYPDRQGRINYCADPYGWRCVATEGSLFTIADHIVSASAATFLLNAGRIHADIYSQSLVLAWKPFILGANIIEANGGGPITAVPGIKTFLGVHLFQFRLSEVLNLAPFGDDHWNVGVAETVPITTRFGVNAPSLKLTVSETRETPNYDVLGSVYWHNGDSSLTFGASATVTSLQDLTNTYTPAFAPIVLHQSTDEQTARVAASMLASRIVPDTASALVKDWAKNVRLEVDMWMLNINVPGEGNYRQIAAAASVDALLIPDGWNPHHDVIQPIIRGGAGSDGSLAIGFALVSNKYGASFDVGFSRQPLTALDDYATMLGIGAAVAF